MDDTTKVELLKSLETKTLATKILGLENALETSLRREAEFKNANQGWLSSGTSDCNNVKQLEAEISAGAQGSNAATRTAWLARQRTENLELAAAISKQAQVAFDLENVKIGTEMAHRKLESALAVLNLKTAQLNFLAGGDK